MAKRHGRNQRRRMRAEIESLQGAACRMSGELNGALQGVSRQRQEIDELRSIVDMTRRILGRHFAALPPIPCAGSMVQYMLENDGAPPGVDGFALVEHALHIVESGSRKDADRIRGMAHAFIKIGPAEFRYAVTEEALRSMPAGALVRMLAEGVAKNRDAVLGRIAERGGW